MASSSSAASEHSDWPGPRFRANVSARSSQADILCTATNAFNTRHISQEAVFSACGQLDATVERSQQDTIADVLSASEYLAGHASAVCSPDSFSLSEAYGQLNECDSISEILRSQALYEADRLWLHAQPALITGPVSSHAVIRSPNSLANEQPAFRAETPSVSDVGALHDETPRAKSDGETSEADVPLPPVLLEVRAVQIVTSLWKTFELAAIPLPDDESLLQESLVSLAMHLVAHHPSHELATLLHVVSVDLALKVLFAPPGPVTGGRTEALNTDDYEVAEEACAGLLALVRRLKR